MKKLFKNIALFLLPLIIGIIILPVDKRMKYGGLKDDCFNHGLWIHDRIFENNSPVDVAILGSSHTVNGVNDELLDSSLLGKKVVNLGYCRLGRNLSYVLLSELLEEKKPALIVLEVRENEDRYSHPIFPYLASDKKVMFPVALFNRDFFSDYWTHFSYKVELTQEYVFGKMQLEQISMEDYGFASHDDTASSRFLDSVQQARSKPKQKLKQWQEDFYMAFPFAYLDKISDLCKKHNIQLIFLYLPSYGSPLQEPKQSSYYRKKGTLLLPPKDILENTDYWYDKSHLNKAGALELSMWLAEEIKKAAP